MAEELVVVFFLSFFLLFCNYPEYKTQNGDHGIKRELSCLQTHGQDHF